MRRITTKTQTVTPKNELRYEEQRTTTITRSTCNATMHRKRPHGHKSFTTINPTRLAINRKQHAPDTPSNTLFAPARASYTRCGGGTWLLISKTRNDCEPNMWKHRASSRSTKNNPTSLTKPTLKKPASTPLPQ